MSSRAIAGVLLAGAMMAGASSCSSCPWSNTDVVDNSSDPKWVKQHKPHAQVAVVFVHGIFGDTFATWGNEKTTFFKLLEDDPEIGPKVDLFAFGYTSKMFGSGSLAIDEAANLLHARLDNEGVLKYPNIVFVNHSMGGLVTLRLLIQRADVRAQTSDVVLFATPQDGAQITLIAKDVARNPALENMLPADKNIFLRTLNDDFKNLGSNRPRVTCAYEKSPVGGTIIVPWDSATRFCDGNALAIAESHITIVKPDRPQHDSFMVVQRVLRPLVAQNLAPRLETPDFAPEGDVSVVTLTTYTGQQRARLVNPGRQKLSFTFAEISPGLYLWPGDTPKDLPPGPPQDMFIGLAWGARATEYSFKLRTDVASPERKIIVRAPDLPKVLAEQQAVLEQATRQAHTALRAAGANPAQPQEVVVKAVYDTIAAKAPDVPEAGRWVYAAEVLNALNWPGLAANALQRAESASPLVAQMPSVQELASTVQKNSGQRVFLKVPVKADPPPAANRQLQPGDWIRNDAEAKAAADLSKTMQGIPALQAQGLSLQGDVERASGNLDAAHSSYLKATAIRPTPSVQQKMKDIAGKRVVPK